VLAEGQGGEPERALHPLYAAKGFSAPGGGRSAHRSQG
jgi:hypothetical protein